MSDRLAHWALLVLSLLATLMMGWGVLRLEPAEGVAPLVERHIGESGASNPVTSMLLNFRAWDTLLEIAVLLAATVALFALRPIKGASPAAMEPLAVGPPSTPLLDWFVPRLVPLAALMAGYLWWVGSSRPGGAFQAGTVLGAAFVLLLMTAGAKAPDANDRRFRLLLASGLLVGCLLAALPLLGGLGFMEYPEGWAKGLILAIEALLTASIAACLVELVLGVPPPHAGVVHHPRKEAP
ncbi:hydrogen gas-evolving membrane-bound hydrogenase subunit E [Telmatospirillum sp. J64-1]|uniref:hydrogen gas-evolving membrane-bound hydrogenase subunit E n=1 Tax=Telmatospirillum sp. J64-1 TaxID=2502183 RepID=UPI00115D435B|nr:hydrogen gas-evolving membrane-bound hydrogenase subunit E [Telmatospirillum sp. J64-1]